VTNCLFSGNSADTGGGMINFAANPTVAGCTFNRNSGSAMHNVNSGPMMTNCVLWGDSPDEISGSATVTHSDVQGGYPGTGNIDADPLFVTPESDCCFPHGSVGCEDPACEALVCEVDPFCCDTEWDTLCADEAADLCGDLCSLAVTDLRLSPGSPCIDAGDNTAVPEGIRRDLDGNPRFVVGTGENKLIAAPPVDMGAYEYQPDSSVAFLLRPVHGSGAAVGARHSGSIP
jgi:hypothetical protein